MRNTNIRTQRTQKEGNELGALGAPFLSFSSLSFCVLCGTSATSAYGCPPWLSDFYCSACTPATSQPPPDFGLDMFQTSRNELAPADGSSRIIPENSTLAR